MKITVTKHINAPIDKVWDIVYTQFDTAGEWMSAVPKSYAKKDELGAGRICEINYDPNKLSANETIESVDENNYSFVFNNVPVNQPRVFPVVDNRVRISLYKTAENTTKFIWESAPVLTKSGIILTPVLKKGLKKGFEQVAEDLKVYAETGKISEAKMKADQKYGINRSR